MKCSGRHALHTATTTRHFYSIVLFRCNFFGMIRRNCVAMTIRHKKKRNTSEQLVTCSEKCSIGVAQFVASQN